MAKKLIYTAEEIDHKLSLIDKNKNLLPYPYSNSIEFPSGLEDVGDGSILASANAFSMGSLPSLLLNICTLPAGKQYIISLEVVDLADKVVENPGFNLSFSDDNGKYSALVSDSMVIDLREETAEEGIPLKISLREYIGNKPNPTVILKPQIEEAQTDKDGNAICEATTWVPYMKTIGSYVDERFNSTNAKIKLLNDDITAVENTFATIESDFTTVKSEFDEIKNEFDEIKNNNSNSGGAGGISDVFIASTSEPENKKLLWIDTKADGGLKYYKEGEGWVTVPVRFS